MPSLALIFHLINLASNKSAGAITVDCVERAAGWCEYLEMHARRIYESAFDSRYQAARKLARKLQKGEMKSPFDARDVYRKEWALLRTKKEVEAACEELKAAGWLRETSGIGARLKTAYLIHPKVMKGGSL